jgi:hypothetical protein
MLLVIISLSGHYFNVVYVGVVGAWEPVVGAKQDSLLDVALECCVSNTHSSDGVSADQ